MEKKKTAVEYAAELGTEWARRTLSLLQRNPDVTFSLEDAYDQGFCEPGIERFLAQYGIESGLLFLTARELAESPHIKEMCGDSHFARVVRAKILEES